MVKKTALLVAVIVLTAFIMTGCVPGDGKSTQDNPAGFFWGAWHGMILPVTAVMSIINQERSVYEQFNTGAWYAVGFALGVLFMLSTLGITRTKRKKE